MEYTIEDLFEMLKDQMEMGNGDTPVHFSYNYGDHWRTAVAPKVTNADLLNVVRSDYHQMDKLTDDDGEEQVDGSKLVFVIS